MVSCRYRFRIFNSSIISISLFSVENCYFAKWVFDVSKWAGVRSITTTIKEQKERLIQVYWTTPVLLVGTRSYAHKYLIIYARQFGDNSSANND